MDYTKLPITIINNYVWNLVSGNVDGNDYSGVWDVSSYEFMPFFPVSEVHGADLNKTPFVIYDYLFEPAKDTQWFIDCEKSVYTIVGEMPQVYYVKNFIYDALKKFDTSAAAINDYAQDSDINFKFIRCEQSNYILDEKRIDSFYPKIATSLILTYDYTKE